MRGAVRAPDGSYGGLGARTFRRVLSDAVADIAEHGYDDPERIERWIMQLRVAAEREVGSPERVNAQMRAALEAIYGRLVEGGGIARYAPEVPRYTAQMLRLQLRPEVDRRILAATDLIRIRREETIEKTLRQVIGWSTSIPPGGVSDETRREVKSRLGKDLQQYRFECRRVQIDQGHKLIANVANIVAVDNGAIAAEWHSHWRQNGYNYRKDHKERDGKFYAIRDSWAMREGLITKGAGYLDEITQPAQEPFCRCWCRYVSSPRKLPDEMLTAKGRAWIEGGKRAS
jgi:hypothetical protein